MLRSWGVAWEITFESMKDHNVQCTKTELKILRVVIITESYKVTKLPKISWITFEIEIVY